MDNFCSPPLPQNVKELRRLTGVNLATLNLYGTQMIIVSKRQTKNSKPESQNNGTKASKKLRLFRHMNKDPARI